MSHPALDPCANRAPNQHTVPFIRGLSS